MLGRSAQGGQDIVEAFHGIGRVGGMIRIHVHSFRTFRLIDDGFVVAGRIA
jgi:hypothetical protein